MSTTTSPPTPETNALAVVCYGEGGIEASYGFRAVPIKDCRKLERERDEVREQLEAMRDELEKVCQQRDAWAMRCDKLGVIAMQEAIREAIDSLHKCSRVIGAPKTYDWADEDVCDAAYNSAQAALTKLQPFLP